MGMQRIRMIGGPREVLSCRKRRHGSREAAEAQRGKLYWKNRRNKSGRQRIEAYWCGRCLAWHLGKTWTSKR